MTVSAPHVLWRLCETVLLVQLLRWPPHRLLCQPLRVQVPCLVELLLSPWLRPVAAGGFRGLMESFVESVADVMREDGDDVGGGRATQLALLDIQDSMIKFAADVSQQLQAPVVAPA